MRPEAFCAWLQGYFDLSGETTLTPDQVTIIRCFLGLVHTTGLRLEPVKPPPISGDNIVPFKDPKKPEPPTC